MQKQSKPIHVRDKGDSKKEGRKEKQENYETKKQRNEHTQANRRSVPWLPAAGEGIASLAVPLSSFLTCHQRHTWGNNTLTFPPPLPSFTPPAVSFTSPIPAFPSFPHFQLFHASSFSSTPSLAFVSSITFSVTFSIIYLPSFSLFHLFCNSSFSSPPSPALLPLPPSSLLFPSSNASMSCISHQHPQLSVSAITLSVTFSISSSTFLPSLLSSSLIPRLSYNLHTLLVFLSSGRTL